MSFLKKIKEQICKSDLFYASEMLRYNADTQYKTLTGGIISIGICITIVIAFATMIQDTFNRTSINFTKETVKQNDPTLYTISTNQGYMIAFQIISFDYTYTINLTGDVRYFDLQLYVMHQTAGFFDKQTYVPIEPCTIDHWKLTPSFQMIFNKSNAGNWGCLPLNYSFQIYGTQNSDIFSALNFRISPCKNDTDPTRSCASNEQIQAMWQESPNFYLSTYYTNPVINAGQQNYITYYVQGNDYIIFSRTIGTESSIYLSDYIINSDNSIWPFEQNKNDLGLIAENRGLAHAFSVQNNSAYANLWFMKDANSLVYKRQVQKVTTVISYIGGMVGAITALMFLVKAYTDFSYQISIGLTLFKKQEDQKSIESVNFYHFCVTNFAKIAKIFKVKSNLGKLEWINECQKQIMHQLDIKLILKRILFLEASINYIFDSHHIEGLKLHSQIEFARARQLRSMCEKQNLEKMVQVEKIVDNVSNFTSAPKIMICRSQDGTERSASDNIFQQSINRQKKITKKSIYSNKFIVPHELKDIPVSFIQLPNVKEQMPTKSMEFELQPKTLRNLKVLHKQVIQGNEISNKIWNKIPENIKNYIEKQLVDQKTKSKVNFKAKNQIENNVQIEEYS